MGSPVPRSAHKEWSDTELDRLYDLFPCASWPVLLAAMPDRTRSAIWQMGKNILKLSREINRRPKWTADEIIVLRRTYPATPDNQLKAAFPRHSFQAIQRKACELKIMRSRLEARNHGRFVHPIIAQLYEERKKQHLNRVQLAKKIGYTHGSILGWELGQTKPDFAMVCDWAQGLGIEITARKRENIEAIVIPYPEKRQLMGGRA